MTICCQCGRHFFPGRNECPGRAQQKWQEAKACGHKPCDKCERYKDKAEEGYEQKK